jgi:hypothetical protein
MLPVFCPTVRTQPHRPGSIRMTRSAITLLGSADPAQTDEPGRIWMSRTRLKPEETRCRASPWEACQRGSCRPGRASPITRAGATTARPEARSSSPAVPSACHSEHDASGAPRSNHGHSRSPDLQAPYYRCTATRMVRMWSPVRFRRGAHHNTAAQAGSSTRPLACPERFQPPFARDLPENTLSSPMSTERGNSDPGGAPGLPWPEGVCASGASNAPRGGSAMRCAGRH